MAESLENAASFFGKHKVAVGVGAAAVVLYFLLSRGSSAGTSGGTANPLQIAQLQASENLQQAQIQAQQNAATTSAQLQQNQSNEALQAEQDQLAAELAGTAYQYSAQTQQQNSTAALYEDLINTGAQEQEQQVASQTKLASQIIPGLQSQHYGSIDLNALALVEGQGNVASYNQGNSSENIASTLETGNILSGLTKSAGGLLGGIF